MKTFEDTSEGDLYDINQLELMEDCLRSICESARKMNEQEFEMAILFDDPQIARSTEQLIGVATEEKIDWKGDNITRSQQYHNDELTSVLKDFVEDVQKKF